MQATLRVVAAWSLLFACSSRAEEPAAASGAPTAAQAAQSFVQEFYDWYLARGLDDAPGASWRHVRNERASSFSPGLLHALDEDAAAQAAVRGVTVGLDFDPFLASQDPDDHYQAGEAVQEGTAFLVSVHAVRHGRRVAETAVVAEVERPSGHWRFIDFKYPQGRELLSMLESLRAARSKK